ncbi:MAG: type 2 lantipeptide synthetase LanM family protein [Verrucomicrobia subdivision 3 bacterium]|nr:type 2 lantipeptide synthetase LanM family protein [Limisphaerales bacterium]
MQRWRNQPPFATGSQLAKRLAIDGLSEADLLRILAEPIKAVRDRVPNPPIWLAELTRAFSRPITKLKANSIESESLGLSDAVAPVICWGRERLRERLGSFEHPDARSPFDPQTVDGLLLTNLIDQLSTMLSRTLALELNVARLQGRLKGETSEERFSSFLEQLQDREAALAILHEYPVLAHQIVLRVDQWVDATLEFLQRLRTDWELIRSTFAPGSNLGLLVQVKGGKGDSHRGGRSVMIAEFSSGFRVVYKPRQLAVEAHFQELLRWVNEHGAFRAFPTLKILDCGSHGWAEFLTPGECADEDAVHRFYERQGGYLALLYALDAADFHGENLIAAGENPILLDLEALFHPRVGEGGTTQADKLALRALSHSVLRPGLLPQFSNSNADHRGVDQSGLGGAAGQVIPFEVPKWEGVGTDEMRLGLGRGEMAGADNRPRLRGGEVNPVEYTQAVVDGFSRTYRLLVKHREELLAADGPLASFAGDEIRFIARPTLTYAVMLFESFHPDFLRDSLDRERFFDRLWAEIEQRPALEKIIPAERDDLLRGDVPMFTTRPDSRDVWTSGRERLMNFLDEPPLTSVRRRLAELEERDLIAQLWYIRASLGTLAMSKNSVIHMAQPIAKAQKPAAPQRLMAAAGAAGDRLEELAVVGQDDVAWIGLAQFRARDWLLRPLGVEFYDGLQGIALFLAYLGIVSGEDRYTRLAQVVLRTVRNRLAQATDTRGSIGAFTGWGGYIYVLTHLAILWERPELIDEARRIVEVLPPLIEKDDMLDVVAGAAGCIGSLLTLHRIAPSGRTLDAAIRCGDCLLAQARPMEHGIGWATRMDPRPLAGFSHGAAGMAWALLELAAVTGQDRFQSAAMAAIAYERSLFSAERGNWPDLRTDENSASDGKAARFMAAWCHGAPGIGLARLRWLQYSHDTTTRTEIDTAVQTTISEGFGFNHSLCHGDLGNLELLFMANQLLPDLHLAAHVDDLAAAILDDIEEHGWRCGTPLGVETPGLMTGLAGIGYGLLRLADPKRVPSVLMLEPPRIAKERGATQS